MAAGTLFLAPAGLGGAEPRLLTPEQTRAVLSSISYFVAENPKTARAFLKAVEHPQPLQALTIETLDEHTPASRLDDLLAPVLAGTDAALLSEAGCPAVADPGALLVRAAHRAGVRVVPLVGPSAVLLALMACGLNGQRFAFHGYLPIERTARAQRLRELENAARAQDATQVFIEAPYRNDALLDAILGTCAEETELCLATDLTQPSESIRTQTIARWKRSRPSLARRPTVFLLHARRAAATGRAGRRR